LALAGARRLALPHAVRLHRDRAFALRLRPALARADEAHLTRLAARGHVARGACLVARALLVALLDLLEVLVAVPARDDDGEARVGVRLHDVLDARGRRVARAGAVLVADRVVFVPVRAPGVVRAEVACDRDARPLHRRAHVDGRV